MYVASLASKPSLPWMPTSKDAPIAGTVKLHEVDALGEVVTTKKSTGKADKGKGRDWLTLFVRETLGKYSPFGI